MKKYSLLAPVMLVLLSITVGCQSGSAEWKLVWEENFDYETLEYLYKLPDDRWMR